MLKLEIGIKGSLSRRVGICHTAKAMKSGTLDVLATPAVVALVEECAWTSVQSCLEAGMGTVGVSVQMMHKAPTPLGAGVRCQTELTQVEGRKLTFTFTVFDAVGEVASGVHERFIINTDGFLQKANKRISCGTLD